MTNNLKSLALVLLMTLSACNAPKDEISRIKSLTSNNYTGKKYYFGWGHADTNDPENMQNETKYDVLHTHEIFTKGLGGKYDGTKLVGGGSTPAIISAFSQIKSVIRSEDMYVQYSSGHGFEDGLQFGGTYSEIAERILSLPAKEIIVFTMACHSGGLVDMLNQNKALWSDLKSKGRTLYVMSSSKVSQTSSTGPDQLSEGPYGSAGSAFGHSLWKALLGEADGSYDGVKDGFIDLGEVENYVKKRTKELGGHDPVTTGIYNTGLIMNRVPGSTDSLSYQDQGTTSSSDDELKAMIQSEDILADNL